MNKKKWLALTIAAVMVCGTMLTGCSDKSKDTSASSDTSKIAYDKDQHLNLVFLEPQSLDPNACSDTSTSTIIGETQEGLTRISNKDGKEDVVTPAGAKSWDISKDGLTYTFHLRDYNWTDGKPVTAQHYVDSFTRLLDQKQAFPYAYFAFDIKNAENFYNGKAKAEDLGVVAKDDKTLVITLERVTPYFIKKLSNATFFPIRLDVIKAGGEKWATDITKQVYCGPYTIKEWVRNNSITLVKNDKYWDKDNVHITQVNMNDIQEFATQAQLFESGQLDVTGSTQEYIEKWTKMAKEGKFQAFRGNTPNTDCLIFNQKNGGPSGIMKNAKVRLAFSLAFDRAEYLNTLLGRYTPAYGWVPLSLTSGSTDFRSQVKEPLKDLYDQYKGNPQKLQELLKEGLKELGKPTDNLKNIHVKYITGDTSTSGKQAQEWWKSQFEKNLGITFDVNVIGDSTVYQSDLDDMKYDIAFYGWIGDYNDPMTFLDMFTTNSGTNIDKFSNAQYDDLYKQLLNTTDNKKRIELYTEMEKILVADEAGIAPVYYGDTRRFLQTCVKGFQYPLFGQTYEWRWAYTEGRNN